MSAPPPLPFNELTTRVERRLWDALAPPPPAQCDRSWCFWCGRRKATTNDHVLPKVKGGRNEVENKVRCCAPCNKLKGGMHPASWVEHYVPADRQDQARALLWRLETWYGERYHSPGNPVTGLGAIKGEL